MKKIIQIICAFIVGLFILNTSKLQAQIADSVAEKTYQGFQKAFLVKSNNQTYFVDGIAKRDRAFFWGQAFLITSMIDAYENDQSANRKQLVVDLLNTFLTNEKQDWSWDGWSDDVAWACVAMARGYQVTGNQTYKTVAANNWKFNFERGWDNFLGGGVWENMDKYTKASLSNNPMIISGMSLYESTGDVYYLNKCKDIYAWFRKSGIYDTITGAVNEAKVNDGTIQYSDHPYNEGSFINAAASLYKYTKNIQYFNDAKKAADHIINTYPIFTEEGDGSARAIAKFAHENNIFDTYYPWLANNCAAAWKNRRTDFNITNNNWTIPTVAGEQFAMQCVSAVTAQMVTPVLQQISDTIEAENYNYKNGININDIVSGGKCANFIAAGNLLEYIVKVPSTDVYTITYRIAGIGADTMILQQDGKTIDSVFFPGTANLQTYTSVNSAVKLKAGIHSLKLIAVSGGWNIDKWIAKSCQAITPSLSVNGADAQQTSSSTIAIGDNITFSPIPTDGKWSWAGPNNYTNNLREITINNVQSAQGGVYSAKYISPNGCINLQDFMLTLKDCTPAPIIPAFIINGDTLKDKNSVTLNAGGYVEIDPQPGNGTWNWTGPNGFTSDSRKISFANIGLKQAGNYTATYYNATGCKSTMEFTITLTGSEPCSTPIIPYININSSNWQQINYGTLNAGGSVEFGPQSNGDNGWSWTGPNGFTAASRSFTIKNFNSVQSGNYIATHTNAAGCKSSMNFLLGLNGCLPSSIVPDITVNDTPWGRTDSIILNSGGNLTIKLPINASEGFLSWTGPYGFTSNSSEISINNVVNWNEGKYKATFINFEGCGNTYTIDVKVTGDDNCGTAIIPKMQVNGGSWNDVSSTTLNIGGTINIGPQPNLSNTWNWTGPGGFTATTREISISKITLVKSGVYSVKYINYAGCWSYKDFVITVQNTTDIESSLTDDNLEINLYPNPTNDGVTLSNIPANTGITVVNLNGQTFFSSNSSNKIEDYKLDLRFLNAGVYLIKLENKEHKTFKIVKK